jgi:predicted RNA-binding Zn-ribbon protein involved in translation (DUF1610 family)
MPRLNRNIPSITSTFATCPQCGEMMGIKFVEPHPTVVDHENHIFECNECGLSRTYLMTLH